MGRASRYKVCLRTSDAVGDHKVTLASARLGSSALVCTRLPSSRLVSARFGSLPLVSARLALVCFGPVFGSFRIVSGRFVVGDAVLWSPPRRRRDPPCSVGDRRLRPVTDASAAPDLDAPPGTGADLKAKACLCEICCQRTSVVQGACLLRKAVERCCLAVYASS